MVGLKQKNQLKENKTTTVTIQKILMIGPRPSAGKSPAKRRRVPRRRRYTARIIAICVRAQTQAMTAERGRSHFAASRLVRCRCRAIYSGCKAQSVLHTRGVIESRISSTTDAYFRLFSATALLEIAAHERLEER